MIKRNHVEITRIYSVSPTIFLMLKHDAIVWPPLRGQSRLRTDRCSAVHSHHDHVRNCYLSRIRTGYVTFLLHIGHPIKNPAEIGRVLMCEATISWGIFDPPRWACSASRWSFCRLVSSARPLRRWRIRESPRSRICHCCLSRCGTPLRLS